MTSLKASGLLQIHSHVHVLWRFAAVVCPGKQNALLGEDTCYSEFTQFKAPASYRLEYCILRSTGNFLLACLVPMEWWPGMIPGWIVSLICISFDELDYSWLKSC
jgi:hypothetical protein